ncbi:hypothetical protein Tco_0231998 [Tanacetum coccineum]
MVYDKQVNEWVQIQTNEERLIRVMLRSDVVQLSLEDSNGIELYTNVGHAITSRKIREDAHVADATDIRPIY